MKNILALIALVLTLAAFIYMINVDIKTKTFARINELKIKENMQIKANNNTIKNVNLFEVNDERSFKPSKLYKLKCASCHANSGTGLIGPALKNKSYKELKTALLAFKDGSRENKAMSELMKTLSLEQIEELAKDISKKEPLK